MYTGCNNTVTDTNLHRFILGHGAWGIDEGGRQFSGAEMIDPGPSYARCSPIQFTKKDNGEIVSNSIFLVRIISMAYYYAHCSVGIHSEVDRFFEGKFKNRVGFELSVHGHHVETVKFLKNRNRRVSTQKKVGKILEADGLDTEPLEWADGDIIRLNFDALTKKLHWWHNGMKQTAIDVFECPENKVEGGSQGNDPSNEDTNIKWCFYVRGLQMRLEIVDDDLTDEEYEILRKSYPSRLKTMKDAREADGPCDDW